MKKNFFYVFIAIAGIITAHAQQRLKTPDASPRAVVEQTVGMTEIRVTYYRPAVHERIIWGDLVPYGEVWRAGANENTTVSFSTPVIIGDREIPPGTYGLHMIPMRDKWTIILNRDHKAWGSFFYNENHDVIRFNVEPENSAFQERLLYTFDGIESDRVTLALKWEKIRIPIPIRVDLHATVLAGFRDELTNVSGFFPEPYVQAVNYCVRNKINYDEALRWIDHSIELQESFANLNAKSRLLAAMGKNKEADSLNARAMYLATEVDLNNLGYSLMGENNFKEALAIFQKNAKEHPTSWNVFDSLGELYERMNDKKAAIENYRKALSLVKDGRNKQRLSETIKKLSGR
ncbi:MAG TPA: DUF2911 domain-containing protein [bacterium]|nr:DUF2911 domain-containing protein [bacterium]HMW36881.1 DUF2911 domain-containing protein [bacterium]HMZ05117.1 DUF2911 domain-containing protein [bacterium]HNB10028.1 DUF2911 domain-containing protein [bacterium]HND77355.1 DUF2911 domain-containing protein [bacterium]